MGASTKQPAGFSRCCSKLTRGRAASRPVPPALPARRLLQQQLLLGLLRGLGGGRDGDLLPAPGPGPAGVAGQVRSHTDVQRNRVLRKVALKQRGAKAQGAGSGSEEAGLRLAAAAAAPAEQQTEQQQQHSSSTGLQRTCRRSESCGPMCRPCSSEGPSAMTEGSSGFCRRAGPGWGRAGEYTACEHAAYIAAASLSPHTAMHAAQPGASQRPAPPRTCAARCALRTASAGRRTRASM